MRGRCRVRRPKRHGFGQVAGDDHPAAKLDAVGVLTLRTLAHADPTLDLSAVARRLGYRVSQSAVSMAVAGRTWRRLPGALTRDRRYRKAQ